MSYQYWTTCRPAKRHERSLYDSILFIINVTPAISGILLIVFLVFCHKMWKYGSKRIQEHLVRDNDRIDLNNGSII